MQSKIAQIDALHKSKAELEQNLLRNINELQDQLQAALHAKAAVEAQQALTQVCHEVFRQMFTSLVLDDA